MESKKGNIIQTLLRWVNKMIKYGLSKELFKKIIAIIEKYSSIQKVYVYGSRARGDYSKRSDLDLAFYGENISSKEINLLEDDLDNLDTIITFDLINIDTIDKEKLSENIRREGVLIYDREKQVKREIF